MNEGLPPLDAQHPWPGLFPYAEGAQAFFNGRERETAELLRLVRRDTFSLLYGQSGLGKSSLLRAGLFPRLREHEFLPIYLRLEFRNRSIPLRQQAWDIVHAALADAGVDGRPPDAGETFWAYFHAADFEMWDRDNRMLVPVLVFDQFEELVQAAEEEDLVPVLHGFMEELGELVENRVPASVTRVLEGDPERVADFDFQARRFHCVLGFREDFLADLEQWLNEHRMPTGSRLRIIRMREEQALAAVERTGAAVLDGDVASRIVSFVSAATRGDGRRAIEIEPALLSVVCFELNNRRIAQGLDRISSDLLSGAQEQIIAEFYDRSVADLPDNVRAFIERELLTESGYRDSCATEDAVHRHGVDRESIRKLVERRVLRQDERFGVMRVELTHDVLAPVVRERREQRQQSEARRLEAEREARRLRRLRIWLTIGGAVAGTAAVLMVVFFNLFREAEHEKERAIEAQSTLFLSRANVSLDNNVPAEPVQYLAQAVTLNPSNQGAIARLVTYAGQRRFPRKLWEHRLGPASDGAGPVIALKDGGFAFGAANGPWRMANVGSQPGAASLREACAGRNPSQPAWIDTTFTAVAPARLEADSLVAAAEFELREASPQPAFAQQCKRSARTAAPASSAPFASPADKDEKDTASVIGVEPESGALWIRTADALVRQSGAVRESVPLRSLGDVTAVFPSPGAAAVIAAGESESALYVRSASGSFVRKATLAQAPAGPLSVAFAPDARAALVAMRSGDCKLVDVDSGAVRWSHPCTRDAAAFIPRHAWIALTAKGNRPGTQSLHVLSLADGSLVGSVDQPLGINHIEASADGELLVVSGQDRTAKVYRLPTLTLDGTPLLHEGAVVESHFLGADAAYVLTASFDGSARIWNRRSGRLAIEPMLHPGPVLFARAMPDGRVITLADDRMLRLWKTPLQDARGAASNLLLATASADGRRIAFVESGGQNDDVVVSRLPADPVSAPLREERRFRLGSGRVRALALDSDGSRIAAMGVEPWVAVLKTTDGSVSFMQKPAASATRAIFVPGRELLATVHVDDTVRVFDLSAKRQAGVPVKSDTSIADVAVSADGRWLSVVSASSLSIADVATGYVARTVSPTGMFAAAAHPLKPQIVFATRAGLSFWRPALDEPTLRKLSERKLDKQFKSALEAGEYAQIPLSRLLVGLRYAPTGAWIAAYSLDGIVTTWDARDLSPGPLLRHSSSVVAVGISNDGRWLTTTTLDAQARTWDPRSGQPMADSVALEDSEREFHLIGNGTWALVQTRAQPAAYNLQLIGLGFDSAPPGWFVPTVATLTGNSAAATAIAARHESPARGNEWWDRWVDTVAAQNGARLR